MSKRRTTIPATIGPTMPVEAIEVKLIAVALSSMGRPTTSSVRAIRDGCLIDIMAPSRTANARMCEIWIVSVNAR